MLAVYQMVFCEIKFGIRNAYLYIFGKAIVRDSKLITLTDSKFTDWVTFLRLHCSPKEKELISCRYMPT